MRTPGLALRSAWLLRLCFPLRVMEQWTMGGVAPDQLEQVPGVQGGVGACVTTGRMFARSLPAHRPAGQAQRLAPVPLPCGSLREVSAGTAISASVDLSLLGAGSYLPTHCGCFQDTLVLWLQRSACPRSAGLGLPGTAGMLSEG